MLHKETMLTLTCLGGAGTVTGSKHLLSHADTRLLIDCGLFQGLKNLRELNWQRLPLSPADIDAVVLTHAHLDHCGYLPRLVAEGFKGKIHATPATRDVAELILLDSANLQEKDADFANRKGFSKHKPALPLYRVVDAERAMTHFSDVALHQETALPGGAKLTLRRAGHILGATTAQIDIGGMRVVFSGDLGRYNDPVMHDPEPVPRADYIVIESTYGNRRHDPADPVEAWARDRTHGATRRHCRHSRLRRRAGADPDPCAVETASGRPAAERPGLPGQPHATSATELLDRHAGDHKLSPREYEAACSAVTYVRDVEESKALSANRYPKVIISASGMATGGRVLHHIAAFGSDHRNTLLFSGFQAAGTRGRKLLNGATETKIYGQWTPINAEIAELPMLSAHADSDELMRWLSGFQEAPRRVFIVHGEPEASEALRERIQRELSWHVTVPLQDQRYEL